MKLLYITTVVTWVFAGLVGYSAQASNNPEEKMGRSRVPAAVSNPNVKLKEEREQARKEREEDKKVKSETREEIIKSNAAIRANLLSQNKDLLGLKGKYQYKGTDKTMQELSKNIQLNIDKMMTKNTRYAEFLEKNPTTGLHGTRSHYNDELVEIGKNLAALRKKFDDLKAKELEKDWVKIK